MHTSIERLLVHESIAGELVPQLVERVRAMRLGAALSYDDDMGSLISDKQLETVKGHVEDAVSKGASVRAGGRPRPDVGPYFYEPTLLGDGREDMDLFADETFGPVVAVSRFSSEGRGGRAGQRAASGLNFSVWTRDTERGRRLARASRRGR